MDGMMNFSCQKDMAKFMKNFKMDNFEIKCTDFIGLQLKIAKIKKKIKEKIRVEEINVGKVDPERELGCFDTVTDIKRAVNGRKPVGAGNIDKISIDKKMTKKNKREEK